MNCANGVRQQVFFPSCWDGVNLDSSDHKSHVAYPSGAGAGTCPESHPKRLISLFYESIWDTNAFKDMWTEGDQQPFVFSYGDPTVSFFVSPERETNAEPKRDTEAMATSSMAGRAACCRRLSITARATAESLRIARSSTCRASTRRQRASDVSEILPYQGPPLTGSRDRYCEAKRPAHREHGAASRKQSSPVGTGGCKYPALGLGYQRDAHLERVSEHPEPAYKQPEPISVRVNDRSVICPTSRIHHGRINNEPSLDELINESSLDELINNPSRYINHALSHDN